MSVGENVNCKQLTVIREAHVWNGDINNNNKISAHHSYVNYIVTEHLHVHHVNWPFI